MSKQSQSRAGAASVAERYSPERPYKPRVSPPSVEDKDACAIYASVRKDATPSHEPVTKALDSLQKMLHRAGNVDGEGDGCGLLVDIPRKIWGEEIRQVESEIGTLVSITLEPDADAGSLIFTSLRPPRRYRRHPTPRTRVRFVL